MAGRRCRGRPPPSAQPPADIVRVDPIARRAAAQAGLTWAEFDHETQAFGLAVTGGLVSSTGIAGSPSAAGSLAAARVRAHL